MKHFTAIPLYIRGCNTSQSKSPDFIELPIGTEVEFIKYGDESQTYSSDPVHANCYSVEEFGIKAKFLFTDKNSIWSFYNVK
jgi:hypothetical protein